MHGLYSPVSNTTKMAPYNPADYGLPPDTTQTSFAPQTGFSPQNGFAQPTDYQRKSNICGNF